MRSRHHRAATGNREYVLDRHQKRPLHRPLRHRNVLIQRFDQLDHRGYPDLAPIPFQRLQRRSGDDRSLIPGKLVQRQYIAHLKLHQLQQLRIIHHVRLVQIHHDVRHAHLAGQQYVLPRLGHRAVRRRDHQDRPVHLRRSRDHVLHVVRVPRAIHVRVVARLALVLHVRRRYRDPARALLRRLVYLVVGLELPAKFLRHHLRQRRR